MKVYPDCIPCLLKRCLFEARQAAPQRSHDALRAAADELCRSYREGVNSARLATRVHKKVYSAIGSADPYAELKAASRRTVREIIPKAERMLRESEDPLKTAVMVSICGNLLDFGAADQMTTPRGFAEVFDRVAGEGLAVDDTERLEAMLVEGARILFLTDNAGEISFDRLLVGEMVRRGCDVTVMVKGEPVLNDALVEDAEDAGMYEIARVADTGMFAVGIDLARADERVLAEFRRADLVVSKGMANWEALSDEHPAPVCYILRAKCAPVADSIGARPGDNVVRFFRG